MQNFIKPDTSQITCDASTHEHILQNIQTQKSPELSPTYFLCKVR
ncbi:hypothetical protein [Dyadobacter chenhuakuii]|nr:hypothetical protein [Dyadobacter chenhuakuii]